MRIKKTVKRAGPVKKAARPVKTKRAMTDPCVEELFAPRVLYLKGFLPLINPGERASALEKERYDFAVRCVRDMEDTINSRDPDILRAIKGRPCYGAWPWIPPLGAAIK